MRRQKAKGKRQRAKRAAPRALAAVDSPTDLTRGERQEISIAEPSRQASVRQVPLPHRQDERDAVPSDGTEVDDKATGLPIPSQAPTSRTLSAMFHRLALWARQHSVFAVVCIAAALSLLSFIHFFSGGVSNLYGDGVAHLNIARKVVDSPDDSLWQRYIQIGTPWLPLQTILLLPLVANDSLWRSGAAGSLVSMLAFVVAATMVYLIARDLYRREDRQIAGWLPALAFAIFVLNPSALFMQATPMTELIFMASLAVAIYFLQRWAMEPTTRRLVPAGLAMAMATLARYEAWPVAALSVAIVFLATGGGIKKRVSVMLVFGALVALGPLYWFWHNWAIFGGALEFLNGPHSARAIFARSEVRLGWSKVFIGHPMASVLWMAVAASVCVGPILFVIGAAGLIAGTILRRRTLIERLPVLLAIVPFLFHAFSVYRGEMQFFPFSAFGLLNVRYGLPHLLPVALFAPALVLVFKPRVRAALIGMAVVVALQYGYLVSEGPSQLAIYQEAYRNGINSARARDWAQAARWLREHPAGNTTWMNTGGLGPLVAQGGLRFAKIIHEGSVRWHSIGDEIPVDVSMIIFEEGDPVAERLRSSAALSRDLAEHFEQRYSAGGMNIYIRYR